MLGPFGVHAQEATDKFSKCDWINEAVQGFGPDYSFVDSMQPDAVLPGARSWGPICVNVDQATEEWFEARPKRELDQSFDIKVSRRLFFYKPTNSVRLKMPLIIWTHPQGDTDVVEPDSFAARDVARDALERGYAFMSLQFRHPTVSQQHYFAPNAPANQSQNGDEPPPGVMRPSTDIATTIQWARHYANTLHIDPLNIFLVGQSRGSLNVLTALMGDRARAVGSGDPPWVDESSLPNAVFAAQAQTTYRYAQLKNFFIKQYATQTVTNRIFAPPNTVQFPLCRQSGTGLFDYWCHYDRATQDFPNPIVTPLSSYDELDRTDTVPVWIRYERTPTTINAITKSGLYVNDPGTYQDNPNIDDNAANCFETLMLAEKVLSASTCITPTSGRSCG